MTTYIYTVKVDVQDASEDNRERVAVLVTSEAGEVGCLTSPVLDSDLADRIGDVIVEDVLADYYSMKEGD